MGRWDVSRLRNLGAGVMGLLVVAAGMYELGYVMPAEAEMDRKARVASECLRPDPFLTPTTCPSSGLFLLRSPPEGPPHRVVVRPSKQVPFEKFFLRYEDEFGLTWRDEMRCGRYASICDEFQQYHDGYRVESGEYRLQHGLDGTTEAYGHVVPGLPPTPGPALEGERACERAAPAVAQKTRMALEDWSAHERPSELLWAQPEWRSERWKYTAKDYRLVFRCYVSMREEAMARLRAAFVQHVMSSYCVDVDARTGEVRAVEDGSEVVYGGPGQTLGGPPLASKLREP